MFRRQTNDKATQSTLKKKKNQTQWLNVKFTKMTKMEPQRNC